MSNVCRRALGSSIIAVMAAPIVVAKAGASRSMIVHRDPGCGCCESWASQIRKAGIAATIVDESDGSAVRARLRVPGALESCHTAEIEGDGIEGHVPATAILRLLEERPESIGLAAPGMPAESPGMETGAAAPEVYDVVLFSVAGAKLFARYRGDLAVL
jgi:hypothetical protein